MHVGSMGIAEEIVDSYSGMITEEQAAAAESLPTNKEKTLKISDRTDIKSLLEFINAHKGEGAGTGSRSLYSADIEDSVYRVFNAVQPACAAGRDKADAAARTMVLGKVGNTMKMRLFGRLAEAVDSDCIERGSTVFVKHALLDISMEELRSGKGTAIIKAGATMQATVPFGKLSEGMRDIDVVGRVVEVGPIRRISRFGREEGIAVADCVLNDAGMSVHAVLWESAALLTASMRIGSFVRIEFCRVSSINGSIGVHATDLSRVLINDSLKSEARN